MDVDWCLSCERRLHDRPALTGPYCSPECLSDAQPSSSISLTLPDAGTRRIRQWARAIPPHIPAGAPALPFADLPFSSDPLPSERPPSPRSRHQPTPKLIERTAACTPLPTLCVSSPAHVRPPQPARAHSHTYSQPNTTTCRSEASTSLTSLLSEPMVATPDEDASFGANIGALVRCWVSRDCANSTKSTSNDWLLEKATDYFPPMPHAKKPSSPCVSAKKSKKTSHSPPSGPRHKHSANKVVPSGRDHTTPTHSHTPTPVIFPSCRAWVDDDDDAQDELCVAPQPQYHPSYYHKYEPPRQVEPVHWTRAPSSLSSSGSSVLLMAPKRADGARGRRGNAIAA